MPYSYEYARAALTTDCVIFGYDETELKVLLIERDLTPFKGSWALPGGFVRIDETVDAAAKRELFEETGLTKVYLEQLYTFGDLDRDPRERTVTVAYFALVKLSDHRLQATTDARDAKWFPVRQTPKLAFDHKEILNVAIARLKGKVNYQPIGFELLPTKFTLTALQKLYETILETELDKRNFRKKILGMALLESLDEYTEGDAHRPAALYKFDKKKYETLTKSGFYFEL
jgi:8-oxo-dGTP diphosphatase